MLASGEGFPIAGSAMLAAVSYAAISMFIIGPMVGERMVNKMEWAGQCARHIQAEVRAKEPEIFTTPKLGCSDLAVWFGREGQTFCDVYGETIDNNPINRQLEAAENAQREAQNKRMSMAADRAGSRCECAVTSTLEQRRVPFAIFAGSARVITPPSVRMLESDLISALNTPACAMKG